MRSQMQICCCHKSCVYHINLSQSLTLFVCTVTKVKQLLSPYGASLDDGANSVCACDQHSFSEASHVNLQVHDDSTAGDPECGTVCSLIDLAFSRGTTTSDQDPLCDVNCLPACRYLSHLALSHVRSATTYFPDMYKLRVSYVKSHTCMLTHNACKTYISKHILHHDAPRSIQLLPTVLISCV